GEAREAPPARSRPHPRCSRSRAGRAGRTDGGRRMSTEFLLPDLGEGLTEAEIVQWLVAPGDTVSLNQNLAEVETAKAVVELPSPYDGVVVGLHAEAGDTVAVGAPLIAFDVAGQEASAPPDAAQEAPAEAEPAAEANLVGYGAAPASGSRPRRRAR